MSASCARSLTLGCITTHVGLKAQMEDERKRCLVEGEKVFDAGHVICCGLKASTSTSAVVQGLCLQTSNLRKQPHELWFELKDDDTITGHCTCKAGNSIRCKHLVAMLIFVNRTGMSNLETLTSTDMAQAWGKLKKTPMYKPKKVRDLCHVQAPPRLKLSKENQARIRAKLIAIAPNSTLAKHEMGRYHEPGELEPLQFSCQNSGMEPVLLIEHMHYENNVHKYKELLFHSAFFTDATHMRVDRFQMQDLSPVELSFYSDHVVVTETQATEICECTAGQNSSKWQRERLLRITGSKCHTLYRFKPSEKCTWEQKMTKLLGQNFPGNDATRYGKASEEPALAEYALNTVSAVSTVGLVVNAKVPWLGYSPDGIVFHNGRPVRLLEIKSPVDGQTSTISELIQDKKLPYIVRDGENYSLRPTHAYYSQVQLGLFLLELDSADLVVYSKVESLVIPVRKCMVFIDNLVRRLQYVYFKHYLPHIAKYGK